MLSPSVTSLISVSVRSLTQARMRTGLTCGLIALAAFAVSCSGGAAASMLSAIPALTSGGARYQARITFPAGVSRCVGCPRSPAGLWSDVNLRQLRTALPSDLLLDKRTWGHVVARSTMGHSLEPRVVPVACIDNLRSPPIVRWADTRAPAEWRASTRHSGTLALIGADLSGAPLAQRARRLALRTSAGTVTLVGYVLRIPDIALEARLNTALVIPFDSDIGARLCQHGARELLLRASSAPALASGTNAITEWVREQTASRPSSPTPLQIETDARLERLLARLTGAIGKWVWIAPTIIAFVCGISALAVNLVFSVERTSEFGIMRAVGARRSDLYRQLILEIVIISGGAIILPLVVSGVSLVLSRASGDRWVMEMSALGAGFAVAAALSTLGVFLPGWHAAKRAVSLLEEGFR